MDAVFSQKEEDDTTRRRMRKGDTLGLLHSVSFSCVEEATQTGLKQPKRATTSATIRRSLPVVARQLVLITRPDVRKGSKSIHASGGVSECRGFGQSDHQSVGESDRKIAPGVYCSS